MTGPRLAQLRSSTRRSGLLDQKDDMSYEDSEEGFPEPEKDMWDDERFETFGQLWKFAVPLAALGVALVGAFASSQYNEGADTYLQSAPGDEKPAFTVPAAAVNTNPFLDD